MIKKKKKIKLKLQNKKLVTTEMKYHFVLGPISTQMIQAENL